MGHKLVINWSFATVSSCSYRRLASCTGMNSDDYYKIREFAEAGGYKQRDASVFQLPPVDLQRLKYVAQNGIDTDRLMRDYVHAILGKLGSFADDYVFMFGAEENQVEVSKPGILPREVKTNEVENDDFIRVQKVVLRNKKMCASRPYVFSLYDWEVTCRDLHKWPHTEITEEIAEQARMDGGYGRLPGEYYGKLSYLKHESDFMFEPILFHLDDWIALHRNGKYTKPGKRINFQELKYVDDENSEGDIVT